MLFSGDQSESTLYRYFHEFYSEVIQIKQAPTECSRIQHQLISVLDRQRLDASQRGGEQHLKLYQEAQYLMVALTDEIFLHLFELASKETWRTQLLEVRIFNSQIAGQRVFENLNALLNKRDPNTLELARLYLIVLFLIPSNYKNMKTIAVNYTSLLPKKMLMNSMIAFIMKSISGFFPRLTK